ncbi:uncharacterized protein LOC141907400 [Tubulanus polymorphus]|uniref:uncharacterized protein LOC141907400 n=1 Tax=Tubulanus polymorphus TaxID=672921 RepID=UPI003DA56E6F
MGIFVKPPNFRRDKMTVYKQSHPEPAKSNRLVSKMEPDQQTTETANDDGADNLITGIVLLLCCIMYSSMLFLLFGFFGKDSTIARLTVRYFGRTSSENCMDSKKVNRVSLSDGAYT